MKFEITEDQYNTLIEVFCTAFNAVTGVILKEEDPEIKQALIKEQEEIYALQESIEEQGPDWNEGE